MAEPKRFLEGRGCHSSLQEVGEEKQPGAHRGLRAYPGPACLNSEAPPTPPSRREQPGVSEPAAFCCFPSSAPARTSLSPALPHLEAAPLPGSGPPPAPRCDRWSPPTDPLRTRGAPSAPLLHGCSGAAPSVCPPRPRRRSPQRPGGGEGAGEGCPPQRGSGTKTHAHPAAPHPYLRGWRRRRGPRAPSGLGPAGSGAGRGPGQAAGCPCSSRRSRASLRTCSLPPGTGRREGGREGRGNARGARLAPPPPRRAQPPASCARPGCPSLGAAHAQARRAALERSRPRAPRR